MPDHFANQRIARGGTLWKFPSDARRIVDRDPIHLRGGQPGLVGQIIDRDRMHHLLFFNGKVERHGWPGTGSNRRPVIDQTVFRWKHPRHHRRVVGPRNSWVHGMHAAGARPGAHELPQIRHRQLGIFESVGREAIEADHDDHSLGGGKRSAAERESQRGDERTDCYAGKSDSRQDLILEQDFLSQDVSRGNRCGVMTRTIEIPLPEELLQLVDERARSTGLDRATYIRAVLSKDVAGEPSLSEVLSRFRNQVASSGINDEDLESLFREAREESYRERNASKH
jgi:predicted DNA binding CopG/RHH family protein